MNPVAAPAAANGVCDSDSDSDSTNSGDYYHPISTANGGELSDEEEANSPNQSPTPNFHRLAENGVSSLDLSDDDDEEEAHEETETAIERAFREDERRRMAPLPAENAVRVMEAMRRVSFAGEAPVWAGEVTEDQWMDRLRRPANTAASVGSAGGGR